MIDLALVRFIRPLAVCGLVDALLKADGNKVMLAYVGSGIVVAREGYQSEFVPIHMVEKMQGRRSILPQHWAKANEGPTLHKR